MSGCIRRTASEACADPASGRPTAALATPRFKDLRLAIEYVPVGSLRSYKRALRKHTKRHKEQLAASIACFGLAQPFVVDADGEIIAGQALLEAARTAGL
jgi:hypothetical protein